MNRHAPYADASVNRYTASQVPPMSAQRMQQNAQRNDRPGQSEFPFRTDGRQQWDTNPQIEMNPMSPHTYSHGHKGNTTQSQPNQRVNYENQANNDQRLESYEQDMEIGYDDKTPQLNFEGLEQRFQDEIMKLMKELSNAEDKENARHKERIVEINTRYQENLSSLRVQYASRTGEFIRKESQTRLHHYEQAATMPGPYGWEMAPDAHRQGHSYGDHPQYHEAMRNQGPESRVPYPHGRVYNNSCARY